MTKLLIVGLKLKKYHIKRVAIIIALTALSVFLLYQIFSFSQELDQYDKSIKSYQKSITVDPEYAEAHNNLGSVFMEIGNYDEAIECYEKAIQIKPDYFGRCKNYRRNH